MASYKVNAVVGQSGGPTSAINATLCGVILGASASQEIDTLYGMENGITGLIEDKLFSLNYLFGQNKALCRLALTPACVLGSARYRLPNDFGSSVYESIFDNLLKRDIKYFFFIGGNDSMDTVSRLNAYALYNGIDISFVGIPKTIDNDLVLTDHTPGYGSCAKYVATVACELACDVSVYREPSVTFLEVMGRQAGWLGCACALPKYYFGKGADLVYVPEGDFSNDKMLCDIENELSRKNNLLVAVSEGVSSLDFSETDAFGHSKSGGISRELSSFVKEKLGCKSRGIELNIPQRCAGHLVSRVDISESLYIGKRAVYMAAHGVSGKMVAFARKTGAYGVTAVGVDLCKVANKVKKVPKAFLDSKRAFVTKECIEYISPLVKGEIGLEYYGGLPNYFFRESKTDV